MCLSQARARHGQAGLRRGRGRPLARRSDRRHRRRPGGRGRRGRHRDPGADRPDPPRRGHRRTARRRLARRGRRPDPGRRMVTRTLAVRLDSLGDVLVTGPAIRALAASSEHLTLLCGPRGRAAAELLPGVDELLCWEAAWIDPEPRAVRRDDVDRLVATIGSGRYDRAVVFTSFHQSALPTALLLRLAGLPWIGALSEDYPGSLLDVRHRCLDDQPEPERALGLARAC